MCAENGMRCACAEKPIELCIELETELARCYAAVPSLDPTFDNTIESACPWVEKPAQTP